MASVIVLVMGVSGAGKTTVARMLAASLGWEFHDGDDLHPAANKAKMHAGHALTDADRAPWLAAIRRLIDAMLAAGRNGTIACSALKQRYRDELIADRERVRLVFLRGGPEFIARRLAARHDHFMNPALLASQFATLEEPRDALVIDAAMAPEAIVAEIRAALRI